MTTRLERKAEKTESEEKDVIFWFEMRSKIRAEKFCSLGMKIASGNQIRGLRGDCGAMLVVQDIFDYCWSRDDTWEFMWFESPAV